MRFSSLRVLLPLGFLATLDIVHGAHLELRGKTGVPRSELQRRTSLSGLQSSLQDDNNVQYMTNITLNGETFNVLIDTGRKVYAFRGVILGPILTIPKFSSDLFVTSTVSGAVDQQFQAGVSYASGGAAGEVLSATMDFAGYTIESQFFISATSAQGFQSDDGLIGLGPHTGSVIRMIGQSTAADPPLDRIFRSNDSISNYLAVLLDRSDDPDEPYPGDLTIGEVLSGYEAVTSQPQLPVTSVMIPGNQHWMTLLDENGIIGPDGQPITIKTQVTNTSYPKNATVVFDTGFTFPQVPAYVAEALYGKVPGAALTNISGIGEVWGLPCNQELNTTFLFAGIKFPIHPLDLNFEYAVDNCIGAFQPFSYDDTAGGVTMYDMVLGMAFLRNSYLLIDFGSFVDEAPPGTNAPFIQLLPLTNSTQATLDFAEVRSVNGTVNPDLLSTDSNQSSSNSTSKKLALWAIGAIIGCVVFLLVVLASCIYCCCRRRRSKLASASASTQPAWVPYGPQYRPLHDPSPQAAYDMHMAPGAGPGYAPEYRNAWDAHY